MKQRKLAKVSCSTHRNNELPFGNSIALRIYAAGYRVKFQYLPIL
jgi:hypothetical protein